MRRGHSLPVFETRSFVKFARRYGRDAHQAVHAHGFASKLQAVECFVRMVG